MINFLFDIDGTLTPPRKPMVSDFKNYFKFWVRTQQSSGNKVYLVTGSDKDKTIEQIGEDLWLLVDGSYQNCGNQLYCKGSLIFENTWCMSEELKTVISNLIRQSKWYGTAANNIEQRIGMVNISTVGRDCTREQRTEYSEWDEENLERKMIAGIITSDFPEVDAAIGGDKSQILKRHKGKNIFFGDMCYEGGNDYAIAEAAYEKYHVADWIQTRDILAVIDKIREIDSEESKE